MNHRSIFARALGCAMAASLFALTPCSGSAQQEEQRTEWQQVFQTIQAYAPLIYLSKDESFLPDTLENYAAGMHMECDGQRMSKGLMQITATDLAPYGYGGPHDDARCIMTTNTPLRNEYDVQPFFHGRKPTASAPVPVYVFVYDYINPGAFTAQYNTFYPYNEGKGGCPLFVVSGNCISPFGRKVFDDHVADWELMTIRFAGGKPASVHVGAHSNSQTGSQFSASTYLPVTDPESGEVKWESTVKAYQLSDFLTGVAGRGPWFLAWEGDHPIVYSAKGSHGIWAQPGEHYYLVAAGDLMSDDTDAGIRWETWRQVQDAADLKYANLLYAYEGDWGNRRMGWSVCDYVKATADAVGGGLLRRGYEFFTGKNACDDLDDHLKTTYQLNGGPSIPDRDRDKAYVDAPPVPPPPPCKPEPAAGLGGVVLYGMGRDGKLYSKTVDPDGAWQAVAGYASTHKIVSIAAKPDGTLMGLDTAGAVFELPAPYSGDWRASTVVGNALLRGIGMAKDGTLLGVTEGGIQQYKDNTWEPLGEGITTDPAPKTAAVMPTGNYLIGTPVGKTQYSGYGYGGNFLEYKAEEGELDVLSWGVPHPEPIMEPPLYSKQLMETLPNNKPQSFTYLPNGTLVFATEIGTDRLIGWYVDNCGTPTTRTFLNAGAPPFGFPGTDATTPQWQSLAAVSTAPNPPTGVTATTQ